MVVPIPPGQIPASLVNRDEIRAWVPQSFCNIVHFKPAAELLSPKRRHGREAYRCVISASIIIMFTLSPVASADGQIVLRVSHTIQLSLPPQVIAVNPTTNKIYVAYKVLPSFPMLVAVIDGATNSVVANVTVGGLVYAMAVNPVTDLVYLAERFASHCFIQVMNGSTNGIIANVSLGTSQYEAPTSIAVDPTTNMVYVTNYDSSTTATSGFANTVSVINGKTDAVVTNITGIYPFFGFPGGIAVNPVTNMIYVINHIGNGIVSVINGTTDRVVTNVSSGATEGPVAVDPSTNRVYLVGYSVAGIIHVIDGASNNVVSNVSVGSSPYGLAVDPTTNVAYVISLRCMISACTGSNDSVLAVDGSRNAILTNLTIGEVGSIVGLAIDPTTNLVYLEGPFNELSVISGVSSSTSITSSSTTSTTSTSSTTTTTNYGCCSTSYTTKSSNTTSSSTSSSGSGGIPEFPVQLGFTLLVTVVIVASYVFARRTALPRL